MKKIIISAVALMTVAATFVLNNNKEELTDLQKENLEALANKEDDKPTRPVTDWDCRSGCHANGDGCYCHWNYPTYRPHDWKPGE